jgi:glucose-1-phosphate adenylyltransferase
MNGVTAFVLAGGRVSELGALTMVRAKSAMPFAGTYRVIDFALSNLSRSGIERVGVLSQYRPTSLMEHVGTGHSWGLVGRGREVTMLPPFQGETGVDWYRGTADAVYQNLAFAADARDVIIVSGDHVYQMDYREVLAKHRRTGADLTMVFKRFPAEMCRQFGNVEVDAHGRAVWYSEKPAEPRSGLGSLTIYVFRRETLVQRIEEGMSGGRRLTHMHAEIIPALVSNGHVQVVEFNDYWAYTRTIDDYYLSSMDLVRADTGLNLADWKLWTNPDRSGLDHRAPAMIHDTASIRNSMVPAGCDLSGTVENCVLSPGVVVEPGAVVRNSVLFQDVRVGSGARVERVIADKRVEFHSGCHVGHMNSAEANQEMPASQQSGVTVVGKDAAIGSGARVGANVQIGPISAVDPGLVIEDGAYVRSNGVRPWQRRW